MASWTQLEEATLLRELTTFKTLGELATRHKRTPYAIYCRLHRIISRSALAGTPCPVADIRAFLKRKPHCDSRQPTLPMMFKETLNRARLQGLAEEHRLKELALFIECHITLGVVGAATQGKTSFLYERDNRPLPLTDKELMDGLRVKFPDSVVTWAEEWVDVASRPHIPPTRVLKKGIKIDWS